MGFLSSRIEGVLKSAGQRGCWSESRHGGAEPPQSPWCGSRSTIHNVAKEPPPQKSHFQRPRLHCSKSPSCSTTRRRAVGSTTTTAARCHFDSLPLSVSFRSFNLPCGSIQPRTAAARRQWKKCANYPRVVLDELLAQALKSERKKYPKSVWVCLPSGGMRRRRCLAGETLSVCEGRLLEVVSSE